MPVQGRPDVLRADAHENAEEDEGQELFAEDVPLPLRVAADEMLVTLDMPVNAEAEEDAERGRGRGRDLPDLEEIAQADLHGFAEFGKLLEGVAQQDERQDLQLLAHGARKRGRQHKDEAQHLHAQDEGEGKLDGPEMAVRRSRQPRREDPLTLEFHGRQDEQIDPEQIQGQAALGERALPELVQPVIEAAKRGGKGAGHGVSLKRGRRRPARRSHACRKDSVTGAKVKAERRGERKGRRSLPCGKLRRPELSVESF